MHDSLMLLHGFTGGPVAFDRVLERLGAGGLRPWLPGHGGHPVMGWEPTITNLLERLEGASHLVGYSMGGRLGWGMLARHDRRITRATFIGAHPGLTSETSRTVRRAADGRWADLLEHEGLEAFVAAWEALPLWETQSPEQRAAQRPTRLGHRAEGLAGALRQLGLAEQPPMPLVEIPVTLVVGEHDLAHRALAAEAQRSLPNATLRIVEGAGHNVVLERPDVLAAILAEDP